jgi:hypothetical protein
MDEGRKRVLWTCASMLAAPKLSELKGGEKAALQTEVNYEAILKAEQIIQRARRDCAQ